MKVFLILWAIGLAASDKLDRTYLPPPGSSLAGGSEDLDLPLEVPKENYPSTLGSENTGISDGSLKPNYPNVAFGIDRQGPSITSSSSSVTTGPVAPTSFPNNIVHVPTTTTSYAFTQTTTLSPVEGFETTLGPFSTVTQGLPISPIGPTSDYSQFLNQQNFDSNIPQQFNPVFSPNVNIPGSIPELYVVQSPTNYSISPPQYGAGNIQQIQQKQYPTTQGNLKDAINNGQAVFNLPTSTPESFSNAYSPSVPTYGGDLDSIPGVNLPSSGTVYPSAYSGAQESLSFEPNNYQGNQFRTPQLRGSYDGYIAQPQSGYGPTDTGIPSTLAPIQYTEGTTPGSVTSMSRVSSTPAYQTLQENSYSGYDAEIRPERVQAEGDRNAVILNYENILTPEGFAYSFDTSNGIHADESGTAVDGVKAQGSYSYIGDDGKVYKIVYTADENGYQPRGDHLPTAPPIPEAILRVIEEAEKNKQLGIVDDGSYDEEKYGHGRYMGIKGRIPQDQRIRTQPDNSRDNLNRKPLLSTTGDINDNNYANSPPGRISSSVGSNAENTFKTEEGIQLPSKEANQSYDGVSTIDKDGRTNNMIDSSRPISGQFGNLDDDSKLISGIYKQSYPQTINDLKTNRPPTNLINRFSNTREGPSKNMKASEYDNGMNADSSLNQNQPIQEGYEYTKPGMNFNSIKTNRNQYPSRFSNVDDGIDSDKQKYGERKIAKPFMTPHVSFNYPSKNNDDQDSGSESFNPTFGNKIVSKFSQDSNNDNIPTYYNKNVNLNRDEEDKVSGPKFDVPRPTASGSYNYQSPYTPNKVQSDQTYNYPTSTLGTQYEPTTTPMPSQFNSRSEPAKSGGVYYQQSTPAPMAIKTGRFSASSPRPSYPTGSTQGPIAADGPIISTGRPINDSTRGEATYSGRPRKPESVNEGQQFIQESSRARPSEDRLNPSFGVSEPNFQSRKYGVQSSTPKIIGEDFSGPGKPQQFDPETGYYY